MPWVLPLWLCGEFADVWRQLNHVMTIATAQIGDFVRIQLFELATVLGTTALHFGGIEAPVATMGVVTLALTGSLLPRMVAKVLEHG